MDDDDDGLEDEAGVEEGVEEASRALQDMLIVCADGTDSITHFSN